MSKLTQSDKDLFKLSKAIREAICDNVVHCADCAAGVLISETITLLTETGRTREQAYALIQELLETHRMGIDAIQQQQVVME